MYQKGVCTQRNRVCNCKQVGGRGEGGGHFGPFCPFTLLKNQKINNLNKGGKKPGDIAILHRCTKTHDHMLYCS